MLSPADKRVKLDCTYTVVFVCVVINIMLIVLTALQGNCYHKGSENIESKEDFEVIREHVDSLKHNIQSLDASFQQVGSELTNTNKDLRTAKGHVLNNEFNSSVEFSAIKESIEKIKIQFDQLNSKFGEVKDVIDEIKSDVESTKMSVYMLELGTYMVEANRTTLLQEELAENLEDLLLENNEDYEYLQTNDEDLSSTSNSFKYADYEESDSHEPMPHTKKVFQLSTEQMNWTEALARCEAEGLQLASITSPEEQTEVVNLIRKADLGHVDFWTSGYDTDQLRKFVWATTGRPVAYTNWNPGEPNNAWSHDHREEEHCISLVYGFGYRWNDSLCGKRKYFVCEERLSRNE